MLLLRTSRGVDPGIPLLRSLGSNAHVWLPGANGVSVASLPSNNYLLSDGSTGYSTVDGVVGLDLDGMGALSSTNLVTNGTFDTDISGWSVYGSTLAWNAGRLQIDGTGLAYCGGGRSLSTVVGKTYIATMDIVSVQAGGGSGFRIGSSFVGQSDLADVNSATNYTGTFSTKFVATTTTSYILARVVPTIAGQAVVDNISCKEYTGVHLTQATTANKPLVRRGMYNQVLHSNNISAWSTTAAGTITNGQTDPFGGTNAQLFSGANKNCYMVGPNAGAVAAGTPVTHAIYCYSAVAGTITIGNGNGPPQTLISVAAGWGVYVLSWTAAANDGPAIFLNGTLTSITIYNQGFFKGTWTAAQILAEGGIPTTTATAASSPSTGKYWWSFDGSNDSLLSGNLGITTACTIVIAGRVNNLSAIQMLFREDNNGVQVYVATNGSVSFGKAGVAEIVSSAAGVIVAGVPFVITVRLSSGTGVIRNLGAQIATAATALTFAATTGARVGTAFDGTSFPLGGALGWVVPIAAALSDADCLTVERLVSSQFPNGPVF